MFFRPNTRLQRKTQREHSFCIASDAERKKASPLSCRRKSPASLSPSTVRGRGRSGGRRGGASRGGPAAAGARGRRRRGWTAVPVGARGRRRRDWTAASTGRDWHGSGGSARAKTARCCGFGGSVRTKTARLDCGSGEVRLARLRREHANEDAEAGRRLWQGTTGPAPAGRDWRIQAGLQTGVLGQVGPRTELPTTSARRSAPRRGRRRPWHGSDTVLLPWWGSTVLHVYVRATGFGAWSALLEKGKIWVFTLLLCATYIVE